MGPQNCGRYRQLVTSSGLIVYIIRQYLAVPNFRFTPKTGRESFKLFKRWFVARTRFRKWVENFRLRFSLKSESRNCNEITFIRCSVSLNKFPLTFNHLKWAAFVPIDLRWTNGLQWRVYIVKVGPVELKSCWWNWTASLCAKCCVPMGWWNWPQKQKKIQPTDKYYSL